ncbi:hypothetical protein CN681_22875 [Bacillus toyonensis]|nr:hypothetical protein [Bacillus cereus group sp. N31]PEK07036.1 hypothetical protein CN681_22875 [Bacillus toyonensis]QWH88668.1 hypothetical protein EXW29_10895 [Bacillus toyonensis]QWI31841.1 hypothetical protein EXW25_10885 [Bacillus toyonensis]
MYSNNAFVQFPAHLYKSCRTYTPKCRILTDLGGVFLMKFQKEYEILHSINPDKILEISFDFKKHRIKIFFSNKEENQFLVLVCENSKISFVKNYPVIFKNGVANIGMHWGRYYTYAIGLSNTTNPGFTEFQKKLKESIQSVVNSNDDFKISFLDSREGIQKIRDANSNSVLPNEAIYYHCIRRTPITDKQFKKVTDSLGKDIAIHLKNSNVTAVFTADITKQKTFVLP